MLGKETKSALGALTEAVHRSETYLRCEKARERIASDEVLLRLVRRYEEAQLAVQKAVLSGTEPDGEDAAEFRRLNLLLLDSDAASEYLLAKMQYEQELARLYELLADSLEIRLPRE